MTNYPLPNFNFDNPKFIVADDINPDDWESTNDDEYEDYPTIENKLKSTGWGNPWPDLPEPDVNNDDISISTINLRERRYPSSSAEKCLGV